jgi:hypothetical protein
MHNVWSKQLDARGATEKENKITFRLTNAIVCPRERFLVCPRSARGHRVCALLVERGRVLQRIAPFARRLVEADIERPMSSAFELLK